MKKRRYFVLTVLILAAAISLAGCAANPQTRWAQSATALTAANNTTADLYQAKVINKEQFKKIYPWLKAARVALDQAWTQLPEGGKTFEQKLNDVANLIEQVRGALKKSSMDSTNHANENEPRPSGSGQ